MEEAERQEIARLAGIAHDKRAIVHGMGMLNVNVEPEVARQNSMHYAIAQAEALHAQANLDAAMLRVSARQG